MKARVSSPALRRRVSCAGEAQACLNLFAQQAVEALEGYTDVKDEVLVVDVVLPVKAGEEDAAAQIHRLSQLRLRG